MIVRIYHETSQKVNTLYHKLNLEALLVTIPRSESSSQLSAFGVGCVSSESRIIADFLFAIGGGCQNQDFQDSRIFRIMRAP